MLLSKQRKSCSGRTFPVPPIILSCRQCKSNLQQAVTKMLPWTDSLTASPATGNPLLVPWLAAVLTCIRGRAWPLSPVFLPQGRIPEPEVIPEETNQVTPHSTWVNFAVQREVIDTQYSATEFSKCLLEGQGEILWPKSSRTVVFHRNCSERLKLQARVTLRKSVGRISIDFIFSFHYYRVITLYSFIILSVMTLMLAALTLTIFKMFWDRQPQV